MHKGDQGGDGYSAFSERDPLSGETEPTTLRRLLTEHGVERLVICGLATDFCVVETVTDARELGYPVVVVRDGVRAVDRKAGRRRPRDPTHAGGRSRTHLNPRRRLPAIERGQLWHCGQK